MQSFLDVTLPPLILLVTGAALVTVALVTAGRRWRLWAAQQRAVTMRPQVIGQALDAMAAVISTDSLTEDLKGQLITAYGALAQLQETRKSIE